MPECREETVDILGVPVAAVDPGLAIERIERWVGDGESAYVTVTGVHGIMASQDDPAVLEAHRRAGMCVPDGMPTVWLGRLSRRAQMKRVYGPDLMIEVMRRSVATGTTHFLYGGKEGVPELLREKLLERMPGLRIVGALSPPFRPMTPDEEHDLAARFDDLSPDFTWVGLSTPKQELWMAAHVGQLRTRVMVGVGAAFDFHAGLLRRAPRWMQRVGLEWLFRLACEPRRLWRRYLLGNPRFVCMMGLATIGLGHTSGAAAEGE